MAKGLEHEAIVLGHTDYGEADRIVEILTPGAGRLSLMARGVRRSKRRFQGALDVGNRIQIQLHQGRGQLPLAGETQLVEAHPHLRGDLLRLSLLSYACEMMAGLSRERHPEPRLFGLLEVALLVMEAASEAPGRVFRWGLETKAATFAGLAPRLDACVHCPSPLEATAHFSSDAGGLLHPHCGPGEVVEASFWTQLERARRTPLADLVDTVPRPGPPWLVYHHLCWHLGRVLRSQSLLGEIESTD